MIDIEEFLVVYLQPVAAGNVSVEMPTTPTLPFVLIERVAGGDDRITDRPIVDVNIFHSTRALSSATATQMHQMMHVLNAKTAVTVTAGTVRIDRVITLHGPSYLRYEDENLKRYVARYEVESRLTA
jgi:hypothetical protein